MTTIVKITDIERNKQEKIVEELVWKKNAYCPFTKTGTVSDEAPLIGYKKIKDEIYLPNAYAKKLLDIQPNMDRDFKKINIKYIGQLRDYQEELVLDAMNFLKLNKGVNFAIHTGGGKTRMMCYIASKIKEVIAVVVTRDTIGNQWKKSFLDDTDIIEEEIAMYGSKFPKFKGNVRDIKLIITMGMSITNIPKDIINKVGFLILDEAHSLCCPSSINGILEFHPKYCAAATATPIADDGKYGVIEAIVGKDYVRKRVDENITKVVYKINTGLCVPIRRNLKGEIDWHFTRDFILTNQRRNELILAQVLLNRDKKIIIMTTLKKHINDLQSLFDKYGIKSSTMCGNQTKYYDAEVLFGTYSKIKEGFDEENTCVDWDGIKINMVIIACPLRKRPFLEQAIGRSRANKVTILHFIDEHPTCHSQWDKDNRIVYKNLKIKIKEEDLSEMELDEVLEGEYDAQVANIYKLFKKNKGKLSWRECEEL